MDVTVSYANRPTRSATSEPSSHPFTTILDLFATCRARHPMPNQLPMSWKKCTGGKMLRSSVQMSDRHRWTSSTCHSLWCDARDSTRRLSRSQLVQPGLLCLQHPHLVQYPLLSLLADELRVRSSTIAGFCWVSQELRNYPLGAVDAAFSETELTHGERVLQLLGFLESTSLIQVIDCYACPRV